jgi:HEPN domain-containing protein
MKKATMPWVRKAEEDYATAHLLAADKGKLHDAVCFHCQQCVEKYIKALLVDSVVSFPKSHDLDRLSKLVSPGHQSVQSFRRGLLFLSSFAVEARYPGLDASKRQAAAAVRWAGRVRAECRKLLGIKAERGNRKRP